MLDNPLGFTDAVMLTGTEQGRALCESVGGNRGGRGVVVGALPLLLDRPQRISVGDRVRVPRSVHEAVHEGAEGAEEDDSAVWNEKTWDGRTKMEDDTSCIWDEAKVVKDHGDGTFQLRWASGASGASGESGESGGAMKSNVSRRLSKHFSRYPGFRLEVVVEGKEGKEGKEGAAGGFIGGACGGRE